MWGRTPASLLCRVLIWRRELLVVQQGTFGSFGSWAELLVALVTPTQGYMSRQPNLCWKAGVNPHFRLVQWHKGHNHHMLVVTSCAQLDVQARPDRKIRAQRQKLGPGVH